MTPAERWAQGELERIIEHPVEVALLDVILGHPANRRVFHYGVEVNKLYYNAYELQVLRRRHGEDLHVDLKYGEEDVGFIHVFDPDRKVYIQVEAVDQEYAKGLRLDQHDRIRAAIREADGDPDKQALVLAKKREMQAVVEGAITDKRMAVRKKGAVLHGINSTAVLEGKACEASQSSCLEGELEGAVTDDGAIPVFRVKGRQEPDKSIQGDAE